MLTNSKIALAVALVLATASAAVAAPKHPVRHDAAIQRHVPANVLINRPLYMTIQDQGIRDGDGY
jgi:hypothetical protein